MSCLDREFVPVRFGIHQIATATNDFAEENLLKRGEKADVYKGQLLWPSQVQINVVIRRYHRRYGLYESHFQIEIERLSRLKHRNTVSTVGFCDDNNEMMIVSEHVVNGSLDKYLGDPTLTWAKRLYICLGAALALRCIGNDFKGFKILLDEDWEAKLLPSIDSENSRVYSLGVILLEMLYGRKASIKDVKHYLAENRYEHVDDIIDPDLRRQMTAASLSIFSKTTYDCLREVLLDQFRTYRMLHQIVERLNEAFEVQWKHDNILLVESFDNFAYLRIPLRQILLATDNFANTHLIKKQRYDAVYKAELNHFDKENPSSIEEENEGDPPKKKVIITRVNKYEKIRRDFFAEVEMLSNCKHPNLLSFLGFCDEDSEMVLVFECAFKESLDNYLINANIRTNDTWETRIQICLDIARGLNYLHNMEGKPNQVIQSANVYLDENFTAKIANFNLFKTNTYPISLLQRYHGMGPIMEIVDDNIHFLGVILFEILTGRLPNSKFYMMEIANGLASVAKLKNMADSLIKEEAQHSLHTFCEITCQCLRNTPSERLTLEVVIMSLEKALHIQNAMLQVHILKHLKIPLENIKSATKNFDVNCHIGSGGYGEVYKAELKMKSNAEHLDKPNTVAIKRITNRNENKGVEGFLAELDIAGKCNHPNIVSLLGFCVEDGELLLAYELAPNGSLDDYLERIDRMVNLTWAQRLKLCIDIAQGLKYMHTTMEEKKRIIHRDIKSANILLGKNWEAKIADFGLSKVHHENQEVSTINTNIVAGTECYLDPEYVRTGRLKKASDIYSFGVVLFEIFSGKLAYDQYYISENEKGIAPIARRLFKKGAIKDLLDPNILDEASELGFIGKVEADHDSLDVFLRIAYQCVAKTQVERPTIKRVIEELEKALHFQENRIKTLKFSLEHIRLGVEDFSDENCIVKVRYGMLYKGKVQYSNRYKKVVIKRIRLDKQLKDTSFLWEHGFLKEFEVLFKYKHVNIIGLVGYCNEMNEKIIVYEHASKGSLNRYLNDTSFSWTKRLKICIDIAKGLKFLHGGNLEQDMVIHGDLKSSNILLSKDWKAKICGFEHAITYPANQEIEYGINNVECSSGYSDPSFVQTHSLTKEYDIYSFGVILFEVLCGTLACQEDFIDHNKISDVLVKHHFKEEPLEKMVFEGIKEQIGQNSLATFGSIAFQCLLDERKERPTAGDVVVHLQKALKFQEAYEIHEVKLHRKYKEISTTTKKDIYNILSKGFLLEDDKMEIVRFLKQTTWNHEQSVQFVRNNDSDYHSD